MMIQTKPNPNYYFNQKKIFLWHIFFCSAKKFSYDDCKYMYFQLSSLSSHNLVKIFRDCCRLLTFFIDWSDSPHCWRSHSQCQCQSQSHQHFSCPCWSADQWELLWQQQATWEQWALRPKDKKNILSQTLVQYNDFFQLLNIIISSITWGAVRARAPAPAPMVMGMVASSWGTEINRSRHRPKTHMMIFHKDKVF